MDGREGRNRALDGGAAMIVRCLLAGAVIAAISLGAARAEDIQTFTVGTKLFSQCRSSLEAEKLFCLGYIEGVVDAFESIRWEQGSSPCTPVGVNAGQLKDVALLYLERHPEDRHHTGASLVVAAIRKAWDCD